MLEGLKIHIYSNNIYICQLSDEGVTMITLGIPVYHNIYPVFNDNNNHHHNMFDLMGCNVV